MGKGNLGYTISYGKESVAVTVTREFRRKAQSFGSEEYNLLRDLRRDYPQMRVEQRTAAPTKKKESHSGLTYDKLRTYIRLICGESSPWIAQFETIAELAKCQNGAYGYVKKWFLTNFPNYKEAAELAALEKFDNVTPIAAAKVAVNQ